jgi:hypothetical protein
VYLIISRNELHDQKITSNLFVSDTPIPGESLVFQTKKVKKLKTKKFPEGFIILSYDLQDKRIFKKAQRKIFRSLGIRALPSIYLFPYAVQENFTSVNQIKEFLGEFGQVYRSPVVVPGNPHLLREMVYEYHRNLAQSIILKTKKYTTTERFSKKTFSELKTDLRILKKRCTWYTSRGVDLKRMYYKTYKAVLRYKHMTDEKPNHESSFTLKNSF